MNQLNYPELEISFNEKGIIQTQIVSDETQKQVNLLLGLQEGIYYLEYLKYKLEKFNNKNIAQNLNDKEKSELESLKNEISHHEKCILYFTKIVTKH